MAVVALGVGSAPGGAMIVGVAGMVVAMRVIVPVAARWLAVRAIVAAVIHLDLQGHVVDAEIFMQRAAQLAAQAVRQFRFGP